MEGGTVSTRFVSCHFSVALADRTTQAIELAAESLSNVKFVQEKRLIQRYFDEISQDTGKYCFGVDDTLKALELGAVETLIVYENLDVTRYVLRNAAGGNMR
jgi:peptide chain release factor subunit 1